MVKLAKLWGIIAIVAVIGVMVLGCKGEAEIWGAEDVNVPKLIECSDCGEVIHECVCISVQNPVATDFIIGNLTQTAGSVTAVTIEPKTGKSNGEITIYYDGSTELPTAAGTYTVTFDVAESTGWNAAKGLNGGMLTINKAAGSFQILADIDTTYMPTLTLADLTLPTGYTWNYPATSLHAGNGQQYPATYTDPSGNYTAASGNITVNVAKANGTFGNPLEINTTYTPALTLANLILPAGYSWNYPTTSLNAGNGEHFPATYSDPSGNYTVASGNIAVNVAKAPGVFGTPSAINTTYTPTLILSNLNLPTGYIWNNPVTSLNAGNGEHFPATYTDPSGNYTTASGNITVNVAKATGVFGTPSVINITYERMLTLANLSLPSGYAWNNPATSLIAGNGQSFSATYIHPSGNYTAASGFITVNVAEASGDFPALAEINITYTPTLTLSNITLPIGYVWNTPTTVLNAGNGQHFSATYTAPSGNFKPANGNITVNVAKAVGTFGSPAAISITYEPTLTLEYLTLQTGYVWSNPATILNAGNEQSFPATYTHPSGNYTTASGNITVNVIKAPGVFGNPSAINTTYTPTLTLASLALPAGYTWNSPATSLNANNGQSFLATFADPCGNYTTASGTITVNVAKAVGTFSAPNPINITYESTLILANIALSSGYTWNVPATSLNAGNGQSFPATYIHPSGNYTAASGNITVNVAKAHGVFGNPTVINTTYTPTLILSNLNLPTGYTWNNPVTSLNAGNGQSFPATYTNPSGNYTAASGNIIINVAKANGATVSTPTLASRTHNSITINIITAPANGQTVEYAINTVNIAPTDGWQTGLTFSELFSGTTYYIFVRALGNNNYQMGTASDSLPVSTLSGILRDKIEYYWLDEHDNLVTTSNGITAIEVGNTLTITVQNMETGYVVKQWHINGTNINHSGNTYNFISMVTGKQTIGLFVEKNGKLYSTNIIITVY